MKKILFAFMAQAILLVACLENEIVAPPMIIEGAVASAFLPLLEEDVTITAVVTTREHPISSVVIDWTANGAAMTAISMTAGADNAYTGIIKGFNDDAEVKWRVKATNSAGEVVESAQGTITWVSTIVKPGTPDELAGKLLIFQAWGSGPSGGAAGNRSFVELYNNTDAPINLQGITLYFADGIRSATPVTVDLPWQTIALIGTIPAKGSYLVLGPVRGPQTALVIADGYGDINSDDLVLSNRAFKVALIRSDFMLLEQNPFNMDGSGAKAAGYIDMVGAANTWRVTNPDNSNPDHIFGYEGVPTRNSGSEAVRRKNLIDTDNNNEDFVAARYPDLGDSEKEALRPRNSTVGSWNPF